MTDVIHLSTDALVKAINDEYGQVLASERSNLQRALAIGEKLKALRSRTDHGEWRIWLVEHGPNLSYETATLYIRLWDNQSKLADAAEEKSVEPTDLTIDDFRRYLAKSKGDKTDKAKRPAKPKAAKAAVEPAMDPKPASLPPEQVIKNLELDYGDMFEALKSAYGHEDLMELTQRLAANLGMVLMPISQSKALMEAIGVPEAEAAQTTDAEPPMARRSLS
jgi:Protein of unknown function (DUF3102)